MKYQPSADRYSKMQYKYCGNSGLLLPRISLGLWHNFGSVDDFGVATDMIKYAFDSGVTHFDLANNYGPVPGSAEINFGKILKENFQGYRDELIISSKAGHEMWNGPYGGNSSRKNLMASIDQSLCRTGLDYFDIFYSHRYDGVTPVEETMQALIDIVKQGKALYVGISKYPPMQAKVAYEILRSAGVPCLISQYRYSMFDRAVEEEVLPLAAEQGSGFIAFSPLAQGLLTNKYLHGIPEHSRAARATGFLKVDQVTEDKVEKARRLNEVAVRRGQTLANKLLGLTMSDDTLIVGTSGRYEFKNKGINVYLESLNRLTRDKNLKKEVLAFINVPGWVGDPREDLVERLKSKENFTTPLECPFITHWLHNMSHDQVLDMMKYLGMSNSAESKVKVIFVPCYLDGKDGILNLEYYDLVLGNDLSVYPSYYEPWGYTPLESVAFHVPTITTDLAGFGLWVNSLKGRYSELKDGVKVIHRSDYNYSEVADVIKDTISEFSGLPENTIKTVRKNAADIAEKALWKHFIKYYYEAYDIALRKARIRQLS